MRLVSVLADPCLACIPATSISFTDWKIHVPAGGAGHLLAQIAKAHGAVVIGTASPTNCDFLAQIGVDGIIDYRTVDCAEAVDVEEHHYGRV